MMTTGAVEESPRSNQTEVVPVCGVQNLSSLAHTFGPPSIGSVLDATNRARQPGPDCVSRGGMPTRHSCWKPVGGHKPHADTQLDQFVRGPRRKPQRPGVVANRVRTRFTHDPG